MLAALLLLALFGIPGLALLATARGNGAAAWAWPRGLAVAAATGVLVAGLSGVRTTGLMKSGAGRGLPCIPQRIRYARVMSTTCRRRSSASRRRTEKPLDSSSFSRRTTALGSSSIASPSSCCVVPGWSCR